MLDHIKLLVIHSAVHLLLYTIPRWLFALLVRAPVTLWELITFKRRFTYSFKAERHIKVVTTRKNEKARAYLLDLFGLNDTMQYKGPMYTGYIHTVLGAARVPCRVDYERELLDGADGNPICLDWLRVPNERKDEVKGVILLVPGLGNYGQTPYMQRLARQAVQRGYHCCVLTPRGMGSAPLTTPNITCVTFTSDTVQTLRLRFTRADIRRHCGGRDAPLFLLAYSAGANTMLQALSEEWAANEKSGEARYKEGFPVTAAIAMTPPTDLGVAAAQMRRPVAKLLIAPPVFSSLVKYLRKHRKALLKASEGATDEEKKRLPLFHVDFEAAMRQIKDPRDIDRYVVAPHFHYKDEQDYYAHGFAPDYIKKIPTVPILYLVCRNDPMTAYPVGLEQWQRMCDAQENLVYVEMPSGGHLGFLQNPLREYTSEESYLQSFPLDRMDALAERYAEIVRKKS